MYSLWEDMSSAALDSYHTVTDYVLSKTSLHGDRTAQIDADTGQRITFSDVGKMVRNAANKLQSTGIGAGSVVAICSKNSLEYVGVLLGTLSVGATAILCSPDWKSRELEHFIGMIRPTAIYAPEVHGEQNLITELFPEIRQFQCSLEDMLKDEASPLKKTITNEFNKIALLLSSSGTTGDPKLVKITHLNLITSIHYVRKLIMENKMMALGLTPFFHAYGVGVMLMALCEGSTLVVMPRYIQKDVSNIIFTYKITHLHTVSNLLTKLIDGSSEIENLKSISHIFTSANKIRPELPTAVLDKLGNKVKMYHLFGMTELTHVVTYGEMDLNRPGSVGCIMPFMKAKIIGHQGETLENGKYGELCINGPTVMEGYYGTEENSAAFTDDGWLRTGDLAWMDNDGYIYIEERIKNIIKFQGYQVNPSELEQVIIQLPGVSEVAVIGVPHEKYGEVPMAYVVREGEKVTENEIKEAVERQLSYYKWLRGGVRFIDSIPKTPLLKVMKKHLQNLQ